ncbi:hypothetical protein [Dyadobacter chenhuakuii]|uniref:Uncharacterized protein n=1 Tax=Dyadobacter chenhuakuii TaxID=2909339 RepID=A0ABY4XGY6_9BACT|nr:hypothetical protein [Dyadobacter chenhuakuii]MCF2495469.1 hypothetical protein [Dyadobacter chenhuakuii]USJ29506.1 hypothetical protein NFI80_16660 [Dyadobacter chenhuakuii]
MILLKSNHGRVTRMVCLFLILVPVTCYTIVISFLHWNLPVYDDYIIQFEIEQMMNKTSLPAFLDILFSQLNEHRLFYTRIIFLLNYLIQDKLSYTLLIFLGNLPLIGIWFIVAAWQRQASMSIWISVFASWMLFQFQYHENSLWAMAALQNITIHFLYLLLFSMLVSKSRKIWWVALAVGGLMCYTSGNGFIALGIGGISLFLQRRWQDLSIWILLFFVTILTYFYQYQAGAESHATNASTDTLLEILLGLTTFIGQGLVIHQSLSDVSIVIVLGFAAIAASALLSLHALRHLLPIFCYNELLTAKDSLMIVLVEVNIFIMLSGLALACNRMDAGDYSAMISSRYQLYPTMLILANVCLFQLLFPKVFQRISTIMLAASIFAWLLIFQKNLSSMYLFSDQTLAYYFNTQQLSQTARAPTRTIFQPDTETTLSLLKISQALKKATVDQRASKAIKISDLDYVHCMSCANSLHPGDFDFVVLKNARFQLLFPLLRNANKGLRSFWLKGKLFDVGNTAQLYSFFLNVGGLKKPYTISLLEKRDKNITHYSTNIQIDLTTNK